MLDSSREIGMLFRIKEAPLSFDGTLEELYSDWAKHVLLTPSIVEEFHKQFYAYLNSADPLFLVRTVARQERGHTLRTEKAARLRPTDNAPAWWIPNSAGSVSCDPRAFDSEDRRLGALIVTKMKPTWIIYAHIIYLTPIHDSYLIL